MPTSGVVSKFNLSNQVNLLGRIRSYATEANVNINQLKRDKLVGYWMFGTSALVYGIIVVGGLTRLTESGLSIVEWKPISGSLPPMNQNEWEVEFEKYKKSPEYHL